MMENIFQYNNILRKYIYTFRDITMIKILNGWLLSRVFLCCLGVIATYYFFIFIYLSH